LWATDSFSRVAFSSFSVIRAAAMTASSCCLDISAFAAKGFIRFSSALSFIVGCVVRGRSIEQAPERVREEAAPARSSNLA
jgi:hypothetical protein